MGDADLSAILRTIREVEVSLDRRAERAGGLIKIVWGLTVATIFGLYQWHRFDPDPLVGTIGTRGIQWMWAPPTLLAYVLTMLTRVRLGRMDAKASSASVRRLLVTMLVPLALIVLMVSLAVGLDLIPAMMVAYLGYTYIGWSRPYAERPDRSISIACFAAAIILAIPVIWPWANGLAAAWYLLFLGGPGYVTYRR